MASRREQILAALLVQLETITDAIATRSRTNMVRRDEDIVIILRPLPEQVTALPAARADRRLLVEAAVYARGAVPDQVADAVCIQAHAQMLADTRLGGLCHDIREQAREWNFEDADQDAVCVSLRYLVQYRTHIKDEEQAG